MPIIIRIWTAKRVGCLRFITNLCTMEIAGMRRIIGIVLILAAAMGLLLSISGIVAIWTVKRSLAGDLLRTFDLLDETLDAASDGLGVADQTLSKFVLDITTIESTIETAGKSIEDTIPLMESFTELLTGDLSATIQSTQTAIVSAQSSAQAIEDTLQLLSAIPLLPIGTYDPEVPLAEALAEVSASLDPIPQALTDLSGDLQTTQDNMTLIATQVDTISINVGGLRTNLSQTQEVLSRVRDVITTLQGQMNSIRSGLPGGLNAAVWFLTVFFIWLGITQIGLLTQGLERLRPEAGEPTLEEN